MLSVVELASVLLEYGGAYADGAGTSGHVALDPPGSRVLVRAPVPVDDVRTSGTHSRQRPVPPTMGLGGTAKKLQKIAEMAEDVYQRLNEMREELRLTKETVEETKNRVDSLDSEVAEQRALITAIAEEQGIDVESVRASVHVDEAEAEAGTGTPADGSEAEVTDAGQPPTEETTRGANPSEASGDGS
jgi:predicted transcriptional regulator